MKSNDTKLIMIDPLGKNGEENEEVDEEIDGIERERNMPKDSI